MSNRVRLDWDEDKLGVTITRIDGDPSPMTLKWNSRNQIPSEVKIIEIYENFLDGLDETEIYAKVFNMPFNKQLSLGFLKSGKFDEALFRLGKVDIKFPIGKDNKLVWKAPKIKKSEKFGFGAGSSSNAAWIDLKDKNSKNR